MLQCIKDKFLDHLSRNGECFKATDFDWVITVPAIWDARGKRMMREAAYLVSGNNQCVNEIKAFCYRLVC